MDTAIKRCSKCGAEKILDEFHRQSDGKFMRSAWCKTCVSEYNKIYKSTHQAKIKAHRGKYYALNRQRVIEKATQWNKKHPANRKQIVRKSSQRHSKQKSDYIRQYRANHPGFVRVHNHRRRTRKRNLPLCWTQENWQTCLSYWNSRCAYCGNLPGLFIETRMCQDHFIPVTSKVCPGTVPTNILPACQSCNSSKNKRDADQWLKEKLGRRRAKSILAEIDKYFEWVKEHS